MLLITIIIVDVVVVVVAVVILVVVDVVVVVVLASGAFHLLVYPPSEQITSPYPVLRKLESRPPIFVLVLEAKPKGSVNN